MLLEILSVYRCLHLLQLFSPVYLSCLIACVNVFIAVYFSPTCHTDQTGKYSCQRNNINKSPTIKDASSQVGMEDSQNLGDPPTPASWPAGEACPNHDGRRCVSLSVSSQFTTHTSASCTITCKNR